jgi:2-oxo-4-hydroxy-4-carboxy-5-ureidoimidazoline decarboxylase
MAQLTLDDLNGMNAGAFVAALGDVFEHSAWVSESAHAAAPFASLGKLFQAMTNAVHNAPAARQRALILAHPDLAGKAARAGEITDDSKAEQKSAGLDRLSATEFAHFHALNDAYRAKFAMPFIVCVRRHGKDSILRQFEQRLQNDEPQERNAALSEILRIAALRLDQRVAAPDRLGVTGWLSTHVLDTQRGGPAAGVDIGLFEIAASGTERLVTQAVTNADGRTDAPLIGGGPVPIATYELRFAVGPYFARLGVALADPPFLGVVPLRFAVAEPESHYHVPLLVTPWSYSTYRGS